MNFRAALAAIGAVTSLVAPAIGSFSSQTAEATAAKVEVLGTKFQVTLTDGRVLMGVDLVGAVLILEDGANQVRVRIDALEPDPKDPGGEIILYTFSALDPQTSAWRNLCPPDPDGVAMGFPLEGIWTPSGEHLPSGEGFSLTCTSGVNAKCVRLGYKPWKKTADGTSLWTYHQACTRMMRADYCGDGTHHTRDGTLINVQDRLGIERFDPEPSLTFEAAWGLRGAICVRHVRIPELVSLEELVQACPDRLAGRVGDACTQETAWGVPETMILNQSRPAGPTR
jgi:ADYC domain